MSRAAPVFATVVLALAVLAVLAAALGRGRGDAPRDVALRGAAEGPRLALREVDVKEIRPAGTTVRLRADRASYAILTRDLSAEGVTVALPAPAGEIVVKAPLASWNMDAGVVLLPDGGRGDDAAGWSATVSEARLDLSAREMTADGASLSGPGVALEGRRLLWKWRDGTLTLEEARGRVLPGKARRRG